MESAGESGFCSRGDCSPADFLVGVLIGLLTFAGVWTTDSGGGFNPAGEVGRHFLVLSRRVIVDGWVNSGGGFNPAGEVGRLLFGG